MNSVLLKLRIALNHRLVRYTLVGAIVYLLVIPGIIISYDLTDSGLKKPVIPRFAINLHESLSPRYAHWALSRIESGQAATSNTISETEWPLFGSVFFLEATVTLQEAWERGEVNTYAAPKIYANKAIEAAARLVSDPAHSTWVKQYYGRLYLCTNNLFYRSLLIRAYTCYQQLTGKHTYRAALRKQLDLLSAEIDASPHGLVEDYPGECYPTDVLAAIEAIKQGDRLLGIDRKIFYERAKRAFSQAYLDPVGLPPYTADVDSGTIHGRSRGCGNSFLLSVMPKLWPAMSQEWYARYEKHYWQKKWTAVGFREFPKDMANREWYYDVDSGPVIAGHGIAACAFGIGAARANGRFDHAYALTSELIVTSWPLINGTLLAPRLLSDFTDAPLLGEAAILYATTRLPPTAYEIVPGRGLPPFTYFVLALYFVIAIGLSLIVIRVGRRRSRQQEEP